MRREKQSGWHEFDEPEVCKLDEFKKFWNDCDDIAKAAIRIWIEEQMQGA